MSKYDSRKELNGLYKRCLSALNRSFKLNLPSAKKCKEFEAQVAKEVKSMTFRRDEDRARWIEDRYAILYGRELGRIYRDPLASLRAQIEDKMD